jgi:hypothetical protein
MLMGMSQEQIFAFVQQGGAYCAPLLLLALFWLSREYRRVQAENEKKDKQLLDLSSQIIEVTTEIKVFLFQERKTS